jgi:hypothetical protein
LAKVLDAHLSPKAGIFQLLFQSPVDVLVPLGIDPGLQTLPDAVHLFYKGNARIVATL